MSQNVFAAIIRPELFLLSHVRLNASRGRGPKSLKLIEFTSQLTQYRTLLGWNWMENMKDLPTFVINTLKLLNKYESRTIELFGIPELQCKKCKEIKRLEDQLVYNIDTSICQSETEGVTIKWLMDALIKKANMKKCCSENLDFNASDEKCVIFSLSHPVPVQISHVEELYGVKFSIASFIHQENEIEDNQFNSNFNFKDQIYCQNTQEEICKSDGKSEKIKLLAFLITRPGINTENVNLQNFIFGTKLQKHLYKHYESVLSPDKYLKNKLLEK
jgi:hypothetical protein